MTAKCTVAPTPICKEAQANGGKVPLACLFNCTRNCMEEHRAANPPPVRRARCSADEFEVMPTEQKR